VIALFGLIGVGDHNQVTAIVGSLTWLLIVEQLLVKLFPGVGKWLSYRASGSLIGSIDADLLPAAGAALLLVGYTAASVAGGMRLTAMRDVTT